MNITVGTKNADKTHFQSVNIEKSKLSKPFSGVLK